jgi:hypothetical protein
LKKGLESSVSSIDASNELSVDACNLINDLSCKIHKDLEFILAKKSKINNKGKTE